MARQIGKMLHAREPKIINGPGKLACSSVQAHTQCFGLSPTIRDTEQVCGRV